MEYSTINADALLAGFEAAGGWYDKEKFALKQMEGMGLGAVALTDMLADVPLFRIPPSCMLSSLTSSLRDHVDLDGLNAWTQLILVMMWESGRGNDSPWAWYMSSMPTRFNTPMFWTDTQKCELIGTEIEHRIGREEAEALFFDAIQPLIQAEPDVFKHGPSAYSLDAFHVQGSRILSRSFNISKPPNDEASSASSEDEDSDEDIIAMVPIADTLNAECHNNTRLIAEEQADSGQTSYTMTTIKDIAAGSQIFNTYLELPDSELLRRYGYVDQQTLDQDILDRLAKYDLVLEWPIGNPYDEVHLDGDRVLHYVKQHRGDLDLTERVEFWLDEGGDDSFSISLSEGVDVAFHAFARLLLNDTVWRGAKKRSQLPDPRPDAQTISILKQTITDRLNRYQCRIQDTIITIKRDPEPETRAALAVRIGEQRCLLLAQGDCDLQAKETGEDTGREKKRVKRA